MVPPHASTSSRSHALSSVENVSLVAETNTNEVPPSLPSPHIVGELKEIEEKLVGKLKKIYIVEPKVEEEAATIMPEAEATKTPKPNTNEVGVSPTVQTSILHTRRLLLPRDHLLVTNQEVIVTIREKADGGSLHQVLRLEE
ncbi:hypothetical protein ACFE04_011330 [Oxalis oulophora]